MKLPKHLLFHGEINTTSSFKEVDPENSNYLTSETLAYEECSTTPIRALY